MEDLVTQDAEHQKTFKDSMKAKDTELKKKTDENLDMETKMLNLSGIQDNWEKLKQEKEDLIKERDDEKRMRSQEVNEKERQKIQATESLRKEML